MNDMKTPEQLLRDAGYTLEYKATNINSEMSIWTRDTDKKRIALFIDLPDRRVYEVFEHRDLYQLLPVKDTTEMGWGTGDLIGTANEKGINLSHAQAKYLLDEHGDKLDKVHREHGQDQAWEWVRDEIIGSVETCEVCDDFGRDLMRNAINVIGDDSDAGYQIADGGSICEACKDDGDYTSCLECELYSRKEKMSLVGTVDGTVRYKHFDC